MIDERWISALTRKLWDMDWDVWNHWNHTLHSNEIPMKFEILRLIDKRVSHHLKKGSICLTL